MEQVTVSIAHASEKIAKLMVVPLGVHRDGDIEEDLLLFRSPWREDGQGKPGLEGEVRYLAIQGRHFLLGGQAFLSRLELLAKGLSLGSETAQAGLQGLGLSELRPNLLTLLPERVPLGLLG